MRASVWVLFLVFLSVLPLNSFASRAMRQESRGCDSFVLQAHSHAAWLGAQRDIEFSEEILLKPDSVLQYSCFVGKNPHPLLTQGLPKYIRDNFGPTAPAKGLLCVQMSSIWKSMKCRDFDKKHFMTYEELTTIDPRVSYFQCNTPVRDGPSGGRQSALPMEGPNRWAGSIGPIRNMHQNQPSAILVSAVINQVEQTNTVESVRPQFNENQKQPGGGNSFTLASTLQPEIGSMVSPSTALTYVQGTFMQPRRWGREIKHAYPPPGTPPINGAADAVVTYNKRIFAFAGQCSDAPPVPTGIKMKEQNRNFDDAVCSIPGCFFNGTACVPR